MRHEMDIQRRLNQEMDRVPFTTNIDILQLIYERIMILRWVLEDYES